MAEKEKPEPKPQPEPEPEVRPLREATELQTAKKADHSDKEKKGS